MFTIDIDDVIAVQFQFFCTLHGLSFPLPPHVVQHKRRFGC